MLNGDTPDTGVFVVQGEEKPLEAVKQVLAATYQGNLPGGGKLTGAERENLHAALVQALGDMSESEVPDVSSEPEEPRTSDPQAFTKHGLPDPYKHKEELIVKYYPYHHDGQYEPGLWIVNDEFYVSE